MSGARPTSDEGGHVRARNHDLADCLIVELEDALQHLLFVFADYPGLFALGKHQQKLFFGERQ